MLRSPLALLALPTLACRFGSDVASHWGLGSHCDLVLMPIITAALVDALRRRSARRTWVALVIVAVITTVVTVAGPLHQLALPSFWRADPPGVVAARGLFAQIPDQATVATTNWLTPQLAARTEVSLIGTTTLTTRPEFLLADLGNASYPVGRAEPARVLARAQAERYRVIGAAGPPDAPVVLLRRSAGH